MPNRAWTQSDGHIVCASSVKIWPDWNEIASKNEVVRNIGSEHSRNWTPREGPTTAGDSEVQGHAADNAFGGTDDEEFIEDGLVAGRVVKEVSHREQHLPARVAEVHERQRLMHLHVEPTVDSRA